MKKHILLPLCLLLCSCVPNSIMTPTTTTEPILTLSSTPTLLPSTTMSVDAPENNCLVPLVDLGYPLFDPIGTYLQNPETEIVLPPNEWQPVAQVPGLGEFTGGSPSLVLIRTWNGNDEVWVRVPSGGLIRYTAQTESWNSIGASDEIDITSLGSLSMLFVDSNNIIWSARTIRIDQFPRYIPLLGKYNDETNQFESIEVDIDHQESLAIIEIAVAPNGFFWAVVQDFTKSGGEQYQLYSIDPETLQMTRHLQELLVKPSIEITPDNQILIIGNQNSLIQYTPETGIVVESMPPLPFDGRDYSARTPRLFLDSHSRLWFDDLGWLDMSRNADYYWYIAVRSPVFITVRNGSGWWEWASPIFTLENPDGVLWYQVMRGTGWLNTITGEWCVFTNYSSPVLTDSQLNLWIIVDGWLYRYRPQ